MGLSENLTCSSQVWAFKDFRRVLLALGLAFSVSLSTSRLEAELPVEPMEIGHVPQFFVDDYIVDNRWALNFANGSKEMVLRVIHPPGKFAGNPFVEPQTTFNQTDPTQPRTGAGFLSVVRGLPAIAQPCPHRPAAASPVARALR